MLVNKKKLMFSSEQHNKMEERQRGRKTETETETEVCVCVCVCVGGDGRRHFKNEGA